MTSLRRNLLLIPLLTGLWACTPLGQPTPTPTAIPAAATTTSLPPTQTPTPTPPGCLTQPGRVEQGSVQKTTPPQDYLIYLPPCYNENPNERYPVLYLLHGQTYIDDQWVRLGAVVVADRLLLSGEASPFIIVFPDDRYWNLPPGAGFGQRLVGDLIPYIDTIYRTLPERNHRAIGGMSRGAGWALRLGFTRWDLFSVTGLHSLAVLQGDRSQIGKWIADIPPDARPSVFMDIGDNDQELNMAISIESSFNMNGLSHEWHLYSGAHTEDYWGAHVEEYIRWYAEQWK